MSLFIWFESLPLLCMKNVCKHLDFVEKFNEL